MKKSVYSLVLMDDIVEAIDEMAYTMNTSRSNLINQILAEKVAFVTPEQHLQTIFNRLSDYLKPYQNFQIQTQAADHMYSVKSALRYKYNPTIRYCLYLNQAAQGISGELRIISRTQSEVLYEYLDGFFSLWGSIEVEKQEITWQREEGAKWLRQLNLKDFQHPSQYTYLANALSEYICMLDQGLKLYFLQIEKGYRAPEELVRHYEYYYHQNRLHV